MTGPGRTLLLWCPDWPVIAADIAEGVPASGPVAVLHANRVVACSEAARAAGIRRGLRKREAQSRCPRLTVVEHDPGRDARAFEPVVAAVEEVAVGVEVVRPGACALAARGPARYFGGEERAAERIVEQVAQSCAVESQVGIADGVFAAGLAARAGVIVAPGGTASFLAELPVEALERPGLTDLLRRLGLRTLGDFAALPPGDVLTRFGFDGALAHRLAAGHDHRPLAVRRPPPDLDVVEEFDEPLERVDVAAFAARTLAERLHEKLAGHGLACTRLGIDAVTADGQELHRVWRHDGMLAAVAIAERVRWQLDGWLSGTHRTGPARPTAGIVRLRLIPDGVIVHLGLQPGLWGDPGIERDRAHRALSRVQGLLGPDAVVTGVVGGGRSADDQVRLVPWGDERTPTRPGPPATDPSSPTDPPSPAVAGLSGAGLSSAVMSAVDSSASGLPAADLSVPASPTESLAGASLAERSSGGGRPAGPSAPGPSVPGPSGVGPSGVGPNVPDGVGSVTGRSGARRRASGTLARRPAGTVARRTRDPAAGLPPWPGRLPRPAPALVLPEPLPAVVHDEAGHPVAVSARLELTGALAVLVVGTSSPVRITGWAGPWPVDERWWAPADARRRARFQVALVDGRALLLSLAGGQWLVEAIYD